MNPQSHNKYLVAWKSADEGQFHQAVKLINEAIDLSPDSTILWVTKAQFLADVNELGAAIECAKKSIQLDSGNHHAFVLLGLIYKRDGNADLSIEYYKQALALKVDHITLTLLALAELDEYPQNALIHANEALKLNPKWEEALDVLQKAKQLVGRR